MSVPTVTELLLARAGDERPGLRFEDETYSWAEHVRASARHAAGLRATLRPDEPPHVGILADNVPAFSVLLGRLRVRRGGAGRAQPDPARCGPRAGRPARRLPGRARRAEVPAPAGRPGPRRDRRAGPGIVATAGGRPDRARPGVGGRPAHADLHLRHQRRPEGRALHPRQDRVSRRDARRALRTVHIGHRLRHDADVPLQRRHGRLGGRARGRRGHRPAPPVLRVRLPARRAEVRRDLRQLRRQATVLCGRHARARRTTPTTPCASSTGTKGRAPTWPRSRSASAARSSTRSAPPRAAWGSPAPTTPRPAHSAGRPTDVAILHPHTGRPCPPAEFDAGGQLLNAEEAVGELVNTAGAGWFAGYYRDPAADAERLRDGRFHTGDLGLRRRRAGSATSPAGSATGCASTGRTSAPRRSSGSCCGTPRSPTPPSTRCPTR